MNGIDFYALPSLEYENGEPLHLTHVMTSFLPVESAVEDFYKTGIDKYKKNYTVGHYGDLEYEWVFDRHEVYQPQDPSLPSMVILRYRPQNATNED